MKTRILFSYTEMTVPPRCRKARPVLFHDGAIEAEIPEVSSTEAPVAIIANRFRDERFKPRIAVNYHWYGSRLWTRYNLFQARLHPHTAREKDIEHRPLPAEVDIRTDGAGRHGDYYLNLHYLANDTKADVTECLLTGLCDHLIIDGLAHRTAGEPRYVVMTFGLGRNHGCTALMTADSYNQNICRTRYFSLLKLDAALALAKRMAKERGDTYSLPIDVPAPRYRVLLRKAIQVTPRLQHPVL